MWTSASALFDANLNHPGPLYFDTLALPVRLLGPWVGLAVGAMLVNMAASSFAVVAGRRISGTDSMVAVAVVVVAMQFAMGRRAAVRRVAAQRPWCCRSWPSWWRPLRWPRATWRWRRG